MAQRLKRWESPRNQGRNHKGRGGSARQRQKQKQLNMLRQKLKDGSNQSPESPDSYPGIINSDMTSRSKRRNTKTNANKPNANKNQRKRKGRAFNGSPLLVFRPQEILEIRQCYGIFGNASLVVPGAIAHSSLSNAPLMLV